MAQRSDPGDREFVDYLLVLWHSRLFILAGTLAAAVVVWGLSLLLPRTYQATGTVMLVESKVAETSPTRPSGDYRAVHEIVRQLLVDTAGLARVIEAHPELRGTSPEVLAGRVETQTLAFSPVVPVTLEASSPELAAGVLNDILGEAIAMNRRMNQDELAGSREYLHAQVTESGSTLQTASEALVAFNSKARLAERRDVLRALLAERARLREQLGRARGDLARASGARAALASRLEGRSETVALSRSVLDDPAANLAAQSRGTDPSPGTKVESEELHPAVVELQKLLEEAIGEEAGAKAEVEAVEKQLAAIDRQLPGLQTSLAELEGEFERVTREHEISRDTYKAMVRKWEDARVLVASRAPDLRLLSPAAPDPSPVSPRPLRYALAAAVAAFILAVCAALVLDYLRVRARRDEAGAAVPFGRVGGV